MKCACGCGQDAPSADRTDRKRDRVKGQPLRYVHGHNRRRPRTKPPEKRCARCGATKRSDSFYRDVSKSDGLRSYCRECVKDTNSASYRANPERIHTQAKEWRALNPERSRAFSERWRKANPAKHAEKENRRRVRKRQGIVEKIDPFAIYDRDGGRCHICGKRVPKSKMTLDHLVPVSKGGDHVALNVRLAHGSCNSSRGDGRLPAQLLLH